MKYLLLFAITPVQSFIAQSRKVRDLTAGSRMLSDLIEESINFLNAKEVINPDEDIVFPFKGLKDKPNRLLTYITTEDPQQIGEDLEEYIKKYFLDKARETLTKYYKTNLDYAIDQLRDLLKIYWVIIPASDNYAYDHQKIERLLGGIKNLRAFDQFAEKGRKCAINGEYNVTIFKGKDNYKPHWLTYTKNVEIKNQIEHSLLSEGEALSTINFYKRVYPLKENKYNATCEIAYMDAIAELSDVQKEIEALKKIDEQYLYKDAHVKKGDDFSKVKRLRSPINKELKNKEIKLSKYYAVLVFDADNLGKWLSGEYLINKENDLLYFQQQLSKQFGEFADYASEYVNGNKNNVIQKGQAVYAGGDDFLGLINLKYLFDVLKELNCQFRNIVWNKLSKDDKIHFKDKVAPMTFSAGVAIAHYKTPLSFVLTEARKAEKTAKDKANRNSVAITVLKRSGEIHQSYFKWMDNSDTYLPDDLAAIISALNTKVSSNKFITSFTKLFLPVIKEGHIGIDDQLIKSELSRLLKDNKVENIEENTITLFNHFYSDKGRLEDFIYLLNIADFIGREINSPHNPLKQ